MNLNISRAFPVTISTKQFTKKQFSTIRLIFTKLKINRTAAKIASRKILWKNLRVKTELYEFKYVSRALVFIPRHLVTCLNNEKL